MVHNTLYDLEVHRDLDCIFCYDFSHLQFQAYSKFQAYLHFEDFALLFLLGVLLSRYHTSDSSTSFRSSINCIGQDGLGYAEVIGNIKTSITWK